MPAITNHMPTAELQALDHAHHMHPFSMHEGFATKGARVITRGDGVWLTDSEGEQILDAMAGLWCVNIGYGRGELADVAARQMRGGFGGLLSIRVVGGFAAAAEVARSTRLFKEATSFGGVESLIEHRAPIEGPGTKVPEDLLRLAVGIEHIDDLITDLDQALARLT